MTEYKTEMRGTLFTNEYKTEDKHPDFKGPLLIKGVEYDMAAWKHVTEDGKERLGVSVSEKQKRPLTPQPKAKQEHSNKDENDIPWGID